MLVAAGGYNGNNLASAEAYDPVADQWAAIADMATARSNCAGAALHDILADPFELRDLRKIARN
jgi:hypothetical protein